MPVSFSGILRYSNLNISVLCPHPQGPIDRAKSSKVPHGRGHIPILFVVPNSVVEYKGPALGQFAANLNFKPKLHHSSPSISQPFEHFPKGRFLAVHQNTDPVDFGR